MGCMCETAMVSIIVPIYNVEAYLKECIDSIRGQTMQEMDIILVDDGSPDSCPQMCDQFAAEDKRIRVFHRENMGVSAARNFGMEQAEADWIMFVDPDDWLEKDAVEVLVRKAVQTNCEIVCGSFYWNYTGRQIQARSKAAGANEYLVRENLDFLFECVICRCDHRTAVWLGTSWGQIYRADYLKENQIHFPVGLKKSEDVVFNLSAVWHAERICILDVPVYHYRIHGLPHTSFGPSSVYPQSRGRNQCLYETALCGSGIAAVLFLENCRRPDYFFQAAECRRHQRGQLPCSGTDAEGICRVPGVSGGDSLCRSVLFVLAKEDGLLPLKISHVPDDDSGRAHILRLHRRRLSRLRPAIQGIAIMF